MLEVRYRKFTVLNIKESNPLFKQQNLSVEQLSTNLKLLLKKTDLTLASTETMEDLERVFAMVLAMVRTGNKNQRPCKLYLMLRCLLLGLQQ